MSKLAVFFPGVGYTVDKPLMYYSRKLASKLGYEIRLLPYSGFPKTDRADRESMMTCFQIAREQTDEMLSDIDLMLYDEVLFIGKSIGTIVAAELAEQNAAGGNIRLVLYTPLEETFSFSFGRAIVFTGGDDPLVGGKNSRIARICGEKDIPCCVIPGADHSLECGRIQEDLKNLRGIMKDTKRFMKKKMS